MQKITVTRAKWHGTGLNAQSVPRLCVDCARFNKTCPVQGKVRPSAESCIHFNHKENKHT